MDCQMTTSSSLADLKSPNSTGNEETESLLEINQLKQNLSILNNQIKIIQKKISESGKWNIADQLGYHLDYSLTQRIDLFTSNTTKGKHPNRPAIALLLCILEAFTNGTQSEYDLKEAVAKAGEKFGLKVTAKGSILGSNLEISIVCQILNALGILEPSSPAKVDDNNKESLSNESSRESDPALTMIIDLVKSLWKDGLKTLQPKKVLPIEQTSNVQSTPANVGSSTAIKSTTTDSDRPREPCNEDSIIQEITPQEPIIQGKDVIKEQAPVVAIDNALNRSSDGHEIDFVCIFEENLFPDEAAQSTQGQGQSDTNMVIDGDFLEHVGEEQLLSMSDQATKSLSESIRLQELAGDAMDFYDINLPPSDVTAEPVTVTGAATQKKASASVNRAWRAKQGTEAGAGRSVYASPESVLQAWGQVHFESGALHELEEKILRRLLEQCNQPTSSGPTGPSVANMASSSSSSSGNGLVAGTGGGRRGLECLGTHYLKRSYSTTFGDATTAGLNPSDQHMLAANMQLDGTGQMSREELNGSAHSSHSHSHSHSSSSHYSSGLTALELIDKVRKSKRQKGSKLQALQSTSNPAVSVQLFEANYLSKLRNIAQASGESYWTCGVDSAGPVGANVNAGDDPSTAADLQLTRKDSNASSVGGKRAESRKSGGRDEVTVAEYCRNMAVSSSASAGLSNSSTNNTLLSAFAASNLFVCGSYPHVTTQTLRRYSRVLDLSSGASSSSCCAGLSFATCFGNKGSGVGSIADLSITTVEIPWRSLAVEFSVVTGDPGLGVAPAAAVQDSNQDLEGALSPGNNSSRAPPGRKRGVSMSVSASSSMTNLSGHADSHHHNHNHNNSNYSHTNSNSSSAMKKGSVDVMAPSFREIADIHSIIAAKQKIEQLQQISALISHTRAAQATEDISAEAEDISDEAMLVRHEGVLRAMRDKWALIQTLKQETRKDNLTSGLKQGSGGFQSPQGSANKNSASSRHFKSYSNNPGSGQSDIASGDTSMQKIPSINTELVVDASEGETVQQQQPHVSQAPVIAPPSSVKKRGRPPKFPRSQSLSSNSYNYTFNDG